MLFDELILGEPESARGVEGNIACVIPASSWQFRVANAKPGPFLTESGYCLRKKNFLSIIYLNSLHIKFNKTNTVNYKAKGKKKNISPPLIERFDKASGPTGSAATLWDLLY